MHNTEQSHHLLPVHRQAPTWPSHLLARPALRQVTSIGDTNPSLQLNTRVLGTPQERVAITELRQYAPAGVEDDLGLQLSPFERDRDEIGVVTAIFRGSRAIGTLRCVPSGHGLTGGERLMQLTGATLPLLEPGSWEVGRLIVDPRERSFQTLTSCLNLAMGELTRRHPVRQFYAIASPAMARLWRRFGLHVVMHMQGKSGEPFVLVLGQAVDVVRILH